MILILSFSSQPKYKLNLIMNDQGSLGSPSTSNSSNSNSSMSGMPIMNHNNSNNMNNMNSMNSMNMMSNNGMVRREQMIPMSHHNSGGMPPSYGYNPRGINTAGVELQLSNIDREIRGLQQQQEQLEMGGGMRSLTPDGLMNHLPRSPFTPTQLHQFKDQVRRYRMILMWSTAATTPPPSTPSPTITPPMAVQPPLEPRLPARGRGSRGPRGSRGTPRTRTNRPRAPSKRQFQLNYIHIESLNFILLFSQRALGDSSRASTAITTPLRSIPNTVREIPSNGRRATLVQGSTSAVHAK